MKPVSTGASISTLKDTRDLSLVHLVLAPWPYDLPSQPASSDIWDYDAAGWQIAKDRSCHEFLAHWRGRSFDEGERILTLGPEAHGLNIPVFSVDRDDKGQILVLDSYKRIFARVILLQKAMTGGVTLTGQPGTGTCSCHPVLIGSHSFISGKTTCLLYLLVRLLSAGEDVALYTDNKTTLFYRNCVYRPTEVSPSFPWKSTESPIWCPLDCNKDRPPPSFLVRQGNHEIFPVQASSTGSDTTAIRKRGVIRLGMPLWTQEEVIEGFKLYINYPDLVKELKRLLCPQPYEGMKIASCNIAVGAALEILDETAFAEIEDVDSRVDAILKELVIRTIGKCGGVPRDVYSDIFSGAFLDGVLDALGAMNYRKLVDALIELPSGEVRVGIDLSHRLIVIIPSTRNGDYKSDTFVATFRTDAIGKQILQAFGRLRLQEARRLYTLYRGDPRSSILSGWIFEALCHGIFSGAGSSLCLSGPLILMDRSTMANDFKFTTPDMALSNANVFSSDSFIRERTYTVVKFTKNNLVWPPKDNPDSPFHLCYCVPEAANNPLFDAFFIDLLYDGIYVVPLLFFLQATLQEAHDGSEAGYPLVQSVKARA